MEEAAVVTAESKRDSILVTVLCALALAGAAIAGVLAFIPHLGTLAVVVTLPAFLTAVAATVLGLVRKNRLVLPALTLVAVAFPAAKEDWREMRIVWVESRELCNPPSAQATNGGLFMLLEGVISLAVEADYRDAIGNNVCAQLGKRYTDHDCDGRIGRMKCEP